MAGCVGLCACGDFLCMRVTVPYPAVRYGMLCSFVYECWTLANCCSFPNRIFVPFHNIHCIVIFSFLFFVKCCGTQCWCGCGFDGQWLSAASLSVAQRRSALPSVALRRSALPSVAQRCSASPGASLWPSNARVWLECDKA